MKLIKANSNSIAICPFCNKKCKFINQGTNIPVKEGCIHLTGVRLKNNTYFGEFEERK